MPMTLAERKRRAAIRLSRRELVKALHAARRFSKYFKQVGIIAKVDPGFPPPFPSVPCGPIIKKVPKNKPLTKKMFSASMARMEVMLENHIRVLDKMLPR